MAHEGIFASSAQILAKAGEDYDTTFSEAWINTTCLEVESEINDACRRNYSDDYDDLNVDVKHLLSKAEAARVAQSIIAYNPNSYPSLNQVILMMNWLENEFNKALKLLRDKDTETWMDTQT